MSRTTKPVLHTARLDPYRLLLLLAIVLYSVIFAGLAFDLHNGLRTHRSDLGQIAQAVWNSSQGRFVEMTDNGFVATRMTDHVEPILALISPLLWLWTDARALLLLQMILVAVGAWPLYELALRRLDTLLSPRERLQIWQIEPLRQMTRPLALALAVAYLLTPQLQSAVLTEFHAAPLAVPLLLWAFWAIDARRLGHFAIATLLVAATKEEMALLAAGLAVWALWRFWRTRDTTHFDPSATDAGTRSANRQLLSATFLLPLLLIVLSLLWFYLATFVIVPAHAAPVYNTTQSVYFERYGALGDSPLDIAKSFVTQPQVVWQIATEPARLAYLWGLIAPFGLLSLLAPELLLLSLPLLLANLLSAYPAQYYGDFHYSAPLVPYVAVSAAYGLARLWRLVGRWTDGASASYQHMAAASSGIMALVSLVTNARTALRPLIAALFTLWLLTWSVIVYLDAGRGPWAAHYDPVSVTAEAYAHQRLLPYFLAQIPPDAAITATAAVHPHVSLRRYVYQFPLGLPELGSAGEATWALLDVTTNTDMAPGDLKSDVDALLAGAWGVVDGADGFLLLRRGASLKTIPDPFYEFAKVVGDVQPAGNGATLPTVASATTQLVRTAATEWPRWRLTKVTAEWLVGDAHNGLEDPPLLDLVTPDGELLYNLTTAAPPALVWYPPARWQPGEQIRVTTLPLALPRFWGIVTAGVSARKDLLAAQSADGQRALVSVLLQGTQGLYELPLPPGSPPFATAVRLNPATATFADGTPGVALTLHGWGEATTVAPGESFLLWLRWSGKGWPTGKTVFVHVRVDEQTVAQSDGAPRFFVFYDPDTLLAQRGVADDVRQLAIPADLSPGTTLSIVVGLYDSVTGERLPLVDHTGLAVGEEWLFGHVTVTAPAMPDQACALIPMTCAAQ